MLLCCQLALILNSGLRQAIEKGGNGEVKDSKVFMFDCLQQRMEKTVLLFCQHSGTEIKFLSKVLGYLNLAKEQQG